MAVPFLMSWRIGTPQYIPGTSVGGVVVGGTHRGDRLLSNDSMRSRVSRLSWAARGGCIGVGAARAFAVAFAFAARRTACEDLGAITVPEGALTQIER